MVHLSQHHLLHANDPRVTDVDREVWLTPKNCLFRYSCKYIIVT